MEENKKNVDTKVDMTYRFTQDDEPTDEQLQVIMQGVAEKARREHEEIAKLVIKNIQRERDRIRSAQSSQSK